MSINEGGNAEPPSLFWDGGFFLFLIEMRNSHETRNECMVCAFTDDRFNYFSCFSCFYVGCKYAYSTYHWRGFSQWNCLYLWPLLAGYTRNDGARGFPGSSSCFYFIYYRHDRWILDC